MGEQFSAKQVLKGTNGRVYVDNDLVGNVKSFEAKISIDKEEIFVNGDFCAKHVPTGYSISGTLSSYKFDSLWLKKYADSMVDMNLHEMTIIGQITDPGTGRTERAALYGVLPDELMLAKFENKTIAEEDLPFTAEGYRVLDTL